MAVFRALALCFQLLFLALHPTSAARKRSSANSTASCAVGGFCSCRGTGSSYDRIRPYYIWSADDVQYSIQNYYKSSAARCQPHSAYAVAYSAMTMKRDAGRCTSGPMKPGTIIGTLLNDGLADLMSRYFVNIESGTAGGADIDGLWADLRSDAERGNFNSLHYAMASTAIYLTSHMGLALSALPHADEIWRDTPYSTISARIDAMWLMYKSDYDAFNRFLADNVNTIAEALYDVRLVSSKNINIAAALVPGGAVSGTFERIRTKTFKLGMQAAEEIPVGQHPLTQRYGGSYAMATDARVAGSLSTSRGSALYELAEHARYWRRWMGDGLGPVWKALGGLDYRDLREGSSRNNACQDALR